MEKYFLSPQFDFVHLRKCLDEYPLDSIFIRKIGSKGGEEKVRENLEGRSLDFKLGKSGLRFFIDDKKVFRFPMNSWGTRDNIGFILEYERFYPDGRQVFLSHGQEPYKIDLPEPKRSILRNCADDHYLEIYFKGRINLQFYKWLQEPDFALWTIADASYKPSKQEQ